MHGDDVASAGVSLTTEMISKANEVIFELIKISIDNERQRVREKASEGKDIDLPGGEVSLKRLKKGGEISVLPSFDKTDLKELTARAKQLDIPIAAVGERGKNNTASVFFNVSDKAALDSIVRDIMREKLQMPEQPQRMITFDKKQVESFQLYCSDHDIPVNFMESGDSVKCVFNIAYEKQMEQAVSNFHKMRKEVSNITAEVVKENGKPKIVVTDLNDGKKLTMNFGTKARLERMLTERLNFERYKAAEVANALAEKLTEEQRKYYYSGSRTLEQMEYFEKEIKFDDDNILTENYSFARMKLRNEQTPRLIISDGNENFVVLSANNIDRGAVERDIRNYLKVDNAEIIAAIMEKAARLGFAERAVKRTFKEFIIERETRDTFTVTGGNTVLRLDLNDREAAVKQLVEAFGMSSKKAERIVGKAARQSVSRNTLERIRSILPKPANTLDHKTRERGSRK